MSPRNHDREVADARSRYLGATARLRDSMRAFHEADVPLDPGRSSAPTPWTREHVRVVIEAARAWRDLVTTRREYDQIRREYRPPH